MDTRHFYPPPPDIDFCPHTIRLGNLGNAYGPCFESQLHRAPQYDDPWAGAVLSQPANRRWGAMRFAADRAWRARFIVVIGMLAGDNDLVETGLAFRSFL